MLTDAGVYWEQADRLAIETDRQHQGWHAGHVNDVLTLGSGQLLAATDTGGVWHIQTEGGHGSSEPFARPLSNDWDNPDTNALAFGPDGAHHVFAGCRDLPGTTDRLYESDSTAPEPLASWHPVSVPAGVGTVYRLAVLHSRRALLLACDGGLYLARIPLPRGSYNWIQALGQGCSGLALGPAEVVVVSTLSGGQILRGSVTESPQGLGLSLRASNLPVQLVRSAAATGRTSLASSGGSDPWLYCVASAAADPTYIHAVLRSHDAGGSWTWLNPHVDGQALRHNNDLTGGQGAYNNCIAASPLNPRHVAIGWENALFTSGDGAETFSARNPGTHLHADIHSLLFDPREPGHLYVSSDGGIARTADLGQSFTSPHNRQLRNLQFASFPERDFWGNASASPAVPGLLAGGLQDNGVVYARVGVEPWRRVKDGDGSTAVFTEVGQLISCTNEGKAEISNWSGERLSDPVLIRMSSAGHDLGGIDDPVTEPVQHPRWGRGGKVMYAVGGNGQQSNVLYGVFGDGHGGHIRWEHLAALPHRSAIWSLASIDGATVYVGTENPAALLQVDSATGGVTPLPPPPTISTTGPDAGAVVARVVIFPDSTLAVAYNVSGSGALLRWSGRWEPLTGPGKDLANQPFYALALDAVETLYAATDDAVYCSYDQGGSWHTASTFLPRRPHCSQLLTRHHGGWSLNLLTFGRSAWRCHWKVRPSLESGAGIAYHHHIGARGESPLYRSSAVGLQQVPLTGAERSQLKSAYHRLLAAVVGLSPRVHNLDGLLADGPHGLDERVHAHEALAAVELGAATLDRLAQTVDLTAAPAGLDRQLVEATALVREGVALLNHLPAPLRTELHAAGAGAQEVTAIVDAVQEVVDTGATLAALEATLA
jgi:hypothetical protein